MNEFIKQAALSVGFDACGIAEAGVLTEDAGFMKQWLSEGQHGSMSYLERNFEKRTDPRQLVPGCKSVIVVLLNYFNAESQPQDAPKFAKYAWSATDYHQVIKTMLSELEELIIRQYGDLCFNQQVQHSFVDSAPVLERRWAQRAGLGWIGKHTQLIANGLGSYCFIGTLMMNAETKYDEPTPDRCGKCTRCIDACPTNALKGKSLNARKCISYQTIENRDEVEFEIRDKLSGRILGCDICAEVCPWNKKWAINHRHAALQPVEAILNYKSTDWQNLTNEVFNSIFKKSAVRRVKFQKLKDNIAYLTKNKTIDM